ncbi:MAG: metal ABC transporter solute-binding protein, Zn/Mn family, partial [Columbia Basin potato purple top phytoplasma]
LIVNGLHLEAKMLDAFDQLLSQNTTKLWKAGEESLKTEDKLKEENSEDCDPHIWFNIDLWIKIVDKLKKQIEKIIPEEDKSKLNKNLEIFKKELEETKNHIIKKMNKLKNAIENKQNKFIIVTVHDAFSYWQKFSESHCCSFELKSIQGISTQTEASTKKIIELAKELANNNVKAIFTESSMPKNSLQSLKEEVDNLKKQKGLDPIQITNVELYSDSLGANYKTEEFKGHKYKHSTYIGAFLNNLKVIEEHLL